MTIQLSTSALGIAVAIALAGPSAAEQKLLIGSTSASSSQYGYFVAVGQIVNAKVPEVTSTVVETGATLDNLRRMERNQVDFGLITTNVLHHAVNGTAEFEGDAKQYPLLWVYSPAPQNVVVRSDSGITDMAGMTGKRINPGIRGSATESTTEQVLAAIGVEPDYVRGSTTDVVDLIKDNRLSGYVKSGAGVRPDASTLDIATFTPISILGLTDDQKKIIKTELTDLSVVDIPENPDNGIPAYSTWSFALGVASRPELSEETAYQIVKAVMEDETAQSGALAELKGVNLADVTLQYGTTPLHPGAARWFTENGYEIPDALKPVSP